jgi:hypothetical protein
MINLAPSFLAVVLVRNIMTSESVLLGVAPPPPARKHWHSHLSSPCYIVMENASPFTVRLTICKLAKQGTPPHSFCLCWSRVVLSNLTPKLPWPQHGCGVWYLYLPEFLLPWPLLPWSFRCYGLRHEAGTSSFLLHSISPTLILYMRM